MPNSADKSPDGRSLCPESGKELAVRALLVSDSATVSVIGPGTAPGATPVGRHDGVRHDELVRHVVVSTGLGPETAARVIADVLAYFGETTEQFVRRRHAELHRRGHGNAAIWPAVAAELAERRVAAAALSERQLRRIVYG